MSPRKKLKTSKSFCVTRFNDVFKASLIWKIEEFTRCPLKCTQFLQSSVFRSADSDAKFSMDLFPDGTARAIDNNISLFLTVEAEEPILIHCEFSLIDRSGVKQNSFAFLKELGGDILQWGYPRFISRVDLLGRKEDLLPDDQLVVSCIVTAKEKTQRSGVCSAGDQDYKTLMFKTVEEPIVDWTAFLDGQPTDIVLRVGDEKVRAHRSVLMNKSPVLDSIIEQSIMQSDVTDEIAIANIEIAVADMEMGVLQSLLLFVYTDQFSVPDVDFALKLLRVADKYDSPDLVRKCCDYLCGNVSSANVFETLLVAEALDATEVIHACIEVVLSEMSSLHDWFAKLRASPELVGLIEKYLPKDTFPNLL